jgi:hypothetical protein
VSPASAAAAALAEYDTNKDGALDAQELERCPALKSAVKQIDKNNDGRLDAGEIEARLASFQQRGVNVMAMSCQVLLAGEPLSGATVRLIPEKFLGDGIKPASGVTDAGGSAALTGEGLDVPGVHCGYYRIEVSKMDGGQEQIPARYNAQTTLGVEVAPDTRTTTIILNLTR